ncbi:MAG: VWA domain-containing protein [Candidatus Eremiobacteraeota bacterium]|nr:VWA domain-containing protein [Candidatus Eremiobacteraeota bacterium]
MVDPLARNVITFSRVLHNVGLPAQPDRCVLFFQALALVGLRSPADMRATGRSIFARSREQQERFDLAFDAFWYMLAPPEAGAHVDKPRESGAAAAAAGDHADTRVPVTTQRPVIAPDDSVARALSGVPAARLSQDGDRRFTYSFAEALRHKDFARLGADELALAHRLTKEERLRFGVRQTRRTIRRAGGAIFDARRALRTSVRRFGEVLSLPTRQRKQKPRDLVLLCDISGSMDRYARLLLQFIHAIRHALGNVEAFVFGTRLTRITRELRHRDVDATLREVSRSVPDWGGGTRIGECLQQFNLHWARRVLAHGAIVMIISDGWDRGDIALLVAQMERLQRRSYRLIWLNPLLGAKNYRPQTAGMRAALPYIDDFLPAHDLRSLAQLFVALRSVDRRRPARAQRAFEMQPLPQGV